MVLLQVSEQQLNILFIITLVLIAIKAILVVFLALKMHQRAKETEGFTFGFVFGVFIVMICLLVSRIFYTWFDFGLTKFDPTTYHLMPNVLIWKIASTISGAGYAYFLFKTDQKALDFKFKGIVSYVLIGIVLLQLFYPVSTPEDFYFISTLDVFMNLVAILIPLVFIYMAWKPSPVRKSSILVALGIIVYAIGANITIEILLVALEEAFNYDLRIIMFLISLILKASGLTMFSVGISQFAIKFSK